MDIKFVQQPTGDTCTSACLAMLTGIPIDTVISEFHQKWKSSSGKENPQTYLLQKGFECEVRTEPFNNCVDWDGIYLVTVASLNIQGGLHHIILDMRGGIETVLDPNLGRTGKKYYTGWSFKSENELAVPLSSWIVDLEIKATKRRVLEPIEFICMFYNFNYNKDHESGPSKFGWGVALLDLKRELRCQILDLHELDPERVFNFNLTALNPIPQPE